MKERYKKLKDSKSTRIDERVRRINNFESSQSDSKDMERIDNFFRFHKKHIWKGGKK